MKILPRKSKIDDSTLAFNFTDSISTCFLMICELFLQETLLKPAHHPPTDKWLDECDSWDNV